MLEYAGPSAFDLLVCATEALQAGLIEGIEDEQRVVPPQKALGIAATLVAGLLGGSRGARAPPGFLAAGGIQAHLMSRLARTLV